MGDVKDNPFLNMKKSIADKEKQKSMKNMKKKSSAPLEDTIWGQSFGIGDTERVSFRDLQKEMVQKVILNTKLGFF